MCVGKKIRDRRRELKMSQEALATKTGYSSKASIARIEAGVRNIPNSKVEIFADALDTTVSYIMGADDDDGPDTVLFDEADINTEESQLLNRIQEKYGLSTEESVLLFTRLDAVDKAKIIERMRTLLEDDKYASVNDIAEFINDQGG